MIVDVHAHLNFPEYEKDLDEVIGENKKAGVKVIIDHGTNPAGNRRVLELAKKYSIIKPSLGIYPVYAAEMSEKEFDKELEFIRKQDIVCLGEIGLDYKIGDDNPHGDKYKEKMKKCFQKFINLAEEKNIPVVVHSRKAELDCIEMLEKSKLRKDQIVMHCFMGKQKLVKRVLENGWSISIPCIVNKLQQLQENVTLAPISQLLTETDSPYLSPYPDIKRNEPRFIVETLKKIAEIKGLDVKEVENIIFMNYQKIF